MSGRLGKGSSYVLSEEVGRMKVPFRKIDIKEKALRVSVESRRSSAYVLELLGLSERNRGGCRAGAGGAPGSQQGESLRVFELEDGLE